MQSTSKQRLSEQTANAPVVHKPFFAGLKAGIPIAIGYIPIAIAFGLLTKASGAPNYLGLLMSFLIYAGASQFVGINLLTIGAAFSEIVLTTFILNLRHFLMGAAISQRVDKSTSKKWLALLAFGLTDETFTVAALHEQEKLSKYFLLGLNTMAFAAWNAGTWAGIFLAAGLPESLKASMGIALYVMFIGLLIPSMKKSRPVLVIALFAMGLHAVFQWLPALTALSTGWKIIIATICSATLGAILFREEDNM